MAPKKALLVMMDETDIHLCPDLKTKGLQPLGQQAKIAGPGLDQVCYLFGSTDPFSGQGLYEIYDQKASFQFCFHLEHLMDTFPNYFIFVAGDNAPAHRSAATTDFLKAHRDRIEFVPLPTYSLISMVLNAYGGLCGISYCGLFLMIPCLKNVRLL